MVRLNFNPALVEFIEKFIENTFSRILVNGQLTPEFHDRRSVRQGDPLSTLLFMRLHIHLEELTRAFPGTIINAYADDILMFMKKKNKKRTYVSKGLRNIQQFR